MSYESHNAPEQFDSTDPLASDEAFLRFSDDRHSEVIRDQQEPSMIALAVTDAESFAFNEYRESGAVTADDSTRGWREFERRNIAILSMSMTTDEEHAVLVSWMCTFWRVAAELSVTKVAA